MNTEYHHNFHSSALDKKKVNSFLKLQTLSKFSTQCLLCRVEQTSANRQGRDLCLVCWVNRVSPAV